MFCLVSNNRDWKYNAQYKQDYKQDWKLDEQVEYILYVQFHNIIYFDRWGFSIV